MLLEAIEQLKLGFSKPNLLQICSQRVHRCNKKMTPQLEALKKFSMEWGKTSEQCKYWN